MDQKTAELTRIRVEELSAAVIHGSPVSPSTSRWLATLGDALHDRLVRAGLCKPRVEARTAALTLVQMLDAYIPDEMT